MGKKKIDWANRKITKARNLENLIDVTKGMFGTFHKFYGVTVDINANETGSNSSEKTYNIHYLTTNKCINKNTGEITYQYQIEHKEKNISIEHGDREGIEDIVKSNTEYIHKKMENEIYLHSGISKVNHYGINSQIIIKF